MRILLCLAILLGPMVLMAGCESATQRKVREDAERMDLPTPGERPSFEEDLYPPDE